MTDTAPHHPETTLAALVGSRLCHDLVSPLGAIGNGVELLAMVAQSSPELDLIAQAVASAQARVRLFRLAFGVAQAGQTLRAADLNAALMAIESNGRVTLRSTLTAPLPRPQARRLALAVLCAESALAWGGTIDLGADSIDLCAPRLRLDAPLWDALATGVPPPDPDPSTVHFALLAASGRVAVARTQGGVTLTL